jgi:hypothetical protein
LDDNFFGHLCNKERERDHSKGKFNTRYTSFYKLAATFFLSGWTGQLTKKRKVVWVTFISEKKIYPFYGISLGTGVKSLIDKFIETRNKKLVIEKRKKKCFTCNIWFKYVIYFFHDYHYVLSFNCALLHFWNEKLIIFRPVVSLETESFDSGARCINWFWS